MDKKQLQEKIEEIIYNNFNTKPQIHVDLTKAAQEIMELFEDKAE